MTTDAAFDALKQHGRTACTAHYWGSSTRSQDFETLRACLLYLATYAGEEPLPDVHVYSQEGEFTFNGPDLEHLIAAAKATVLAN